MVLIFKKKRKEGLKGKSGHKKIIWEKHAHLDFYLLLSEYTKSIYMHEYM